MDWIKKFFKEMKRVRWIKGKKMTKVLGTTLIFVIISGLFLFGVQWVFTSLWSAIGIGL